MKKTLLSAVALLASMVASAAAPSLLWHKMIDSPKNAGDIMRCATVTTDGNVVTLGAFGSATDTDNITFDGEVIGTGAATNSSSDNQNLLAIKHNAKDGSRIWSIYSKKGDFATMGAQAMTGTPDGGVLMLVDMRSSSVTPYESPVIVDASGAEIDFPDWNVSCWVTYQTLVKLSAQGTVEWIRPIIADQLPVPNASSGTSTQYTSRSAFPYALALDAEGNIYIGGNFRTPMIFNGEGNSTYVLQPRNLESYNGDTQGQYGALYLVKLDAEGNYLSHLQASSADGVTGEYINDMVIDNDKIYFTGNFLGKKGSTLTIGKGTTAKSVTKSTDDFAALVGCVSIKAGSNVMTPEFLTCYNLIKVSNKGAVQIKGLLYNEGSLYLTGLFQGSIAVNDSEEAFIKSVNTMLEGYCIKMSATDGSYQASLANKLSIGGYIGGGFYEGKLYLAGYRMNAATGTFIDEIDPSTLEILSTTTVAKAGGAPTLQYAYFNPATSCMYTLTRGNNSFTLTDDSATEKTTGFGTVVCAHAVDASLAGVNNVASDSKSFTVKGLEGAVEVTATDDTDIRVVDLGGITIVSRTVAAGSTIIELPAGVYIVNDVKVAVR